MINRTITIKRTSSTISFVANKKAIKQQMTLIKDRAFKSMSIIAEGNKRFVDKWQKMEVYPFCD